MKTRIFLLTTVAALALTACLVPSVNPYYTKSDVAFEPRLVGEWKHAEEKESQTWSFEAGDDTSYKLTVTDRDEKGVKEGKLTAYLFKLKDERFLDVIPSDCDFAPDQAPVVSVAMFPGHLLFRVREIGPGLKLEFCDTDWLTKFLKANPEALAHHKEGDRLLITASTVDLQAFILKHLGKDELFGDAMEFKREPAKVAAP